MRKNLFFDLSNAICYLSIIICVAVLGNACGKKEAEEAVNKSKVSFKGSNQITSIDSTVTNRLGPPSSVSAKYSTSLNPTISDDFNDATVDFTKWQYRTDGSSSWDVSGSNVYIASVGAERFLTLKGSYPDKKGSGITARQALKYGFYIVKWQVIGISNSQSTGWHPAIWGAGCDFSGSPQGNCISEVSNNLPRLEADFMEGFEGANPYWNSHLILWPGKYGIVSISNQSNWPNTTGNWGILGFEYTPTAIVTWQYTAGVWTKKKTVTISGNPNSSSNINSAYATQLYWILSNKAHKPDLITTNSWFRIDYFYHYSYIGQ